MSDTTRHTKLDERGAPLPADATDHAILIDSLHGLAWDVRALHRGDHQSCLDYAANSHLLGLQWRLPTALELFRDVSDRTRYAPACNPQLYPRLGESWIWSADLDSDPEYAASPVYAWGVYLGGGLALIPSRNGLGLALPVAAWASS